MMERASLENGGPDAPGTPPFTLTFAICLLTLYVIVYVAPFYLSASIRPSPTLRRDAPEVMIGRIRSVTFSTAFIVLTTLVVLTYLPDHGDILESLHLMGFLPVGLYSAAKVLLLTMILFAGPIFEAGVCEGDWQDWVRLRFITCLFNGKLTLPNFRTLVVGPITEELLFRSAALPLFLLTPQGDSLKTLFFIPPIIFGLAHVHHIHEFRLANPRAPLYVGIIRSVFQLGYTTLFGSFTTFAYLRTGSVLGVILAHMFCNYLGLPRFWGRVTGGDGGGAEAVMGPDVGKKNDDAGNSQDQRESRAQDFGGPKELAIGYSIMYYVLLVAGAYGFYKYYWVLTESNNALLEF